MKGLNLPLITMNQSKRIKGGPRQENEDDCITLKQLFVRGNPFDPRAAKRCPRSINSEGDFK
jgi:hypothetical protein